MQNTDNLKKGKIFFNKCVPVFVVAEMKKRELNELVSTVKNVH